MTATLIGLTVIGVALSVGTIAILILDIFPNLLVVAILCYLAFNIGESIFGQL